MDQQRFVGIVVGFVTVAITLLVLGQFEREAEGKVPYDCVDATERESVRELALKGIDEGFEQAVSHLLRCLAKRSQHRAAARAQVGTTNAVNAHNRARKLALAWYPPTCPPEK